MIDIGADLQRAFDEGYEKGKADEHRWWSEHCANCTDGDRPQGDVDAVDIFEREMHNLEQGYITIGEFDERIEPLRHLCYDRPRGEWIVRFPYEDTGKTRTCSNCNITQTVNVYDGVVRFKFCPYCGARMRGTDDE